MNKQTVLYIMLNEIHYSFYNVTLVSIRFKTCNKIDLLRIIVCISIYLRLKTHFGLLCVIVVCIVCVFLIPHQIDMSLVLLLCKTSVVQFYVNCIIWEHNSFFHQFHWFVGLVSKITTWYSRLCFTYTIYVLLMFMAFMIKWVWLYNNFNKTECNYYSYL